MSTFGSRHYKNVDIDKVDISDEKYSNKSESIRWRKSMLKQKDKGTLSTYTHWVTYPYHPSGLTLSFFQGTPRSSTSWTHFLILSCQNPPQNPELCSIYLSRTQKMSLLRPYWGLTNISHVKSATKVPTRVTTRHSLY